MPQQPIVFDEKLLGGTGPHPPASLIKLPGTPQSPAHQPNDAKSGMTSGFESGITDAALLGSGLLGPEIGVPVGAGIGAIRAAEKGDNPWVGAITQGALNAVPAGGRLVARGANRAALGLGGIKVGAPEVAAALARQRLDLRGEGDPYGRAEANAASPYAVRDVAPPPNMQSIARKMFGLKGQGGQNAISLGFPQRTKQLADATGDTLSKVESADPTKYNIGQLVHEGSPDITALRSRVAGTGNGALDQDMISKIIDSVRRNSAVSLPRTGADGRPVYPGMAQFHDSYANHTADLRGRGIEPPSREDAMETLINNTDMNGRQVGNLKRGEAKLSNWTPAGETTPGQAARETVKAGTHGALATTLKGAQEASNPAVKPINSAASDQYKIAAANNALRGGTGPISDISTIGRQGGLTNQIVRHTPLPEPLASLAGLGGMVGLRPSVISAVGNALATGAGAVPGSTRLIQSLMDLFGGKGGGQ